jgi:hypothetical protein
MLARTAGGRIAACALGIALLGPALRAADVEVGASVPTNDDHVRAEDKSLKATLADGVDHSTTFKAIVDHLQQSDVVVYLVYERAPRASLASHVSFLSVAGGRRYLTISFSGRLPRVRQVSILGHELQHAVEIADAPSVVDATSMAKYYAGLKYGGVVDPSFTHRFESRQAIHVEMKIVREMAVPKGKGPVQ